jgi:glutamine amidotransferase
MTSRRVAIVDYRMGNLRSVANAFAILGSDVTIATTPDFLFDATHIVLPGVGAFGDGIANLERGGWIPALDVEVRTKRKPFLGICLGMQLLASTGTEHGNWRGLGWIPGTVTKLHPLEKALRIPHIGWNDVVPTHAATLLSGLSGAPCFYFVHSFAMVPEDQAVVAGRTAYGAPFVSVIETANIHGVQFHPEKSHKVGLSLLSKFLALEPSAC